MKRVLMSLIFAIFTFVLVGCGEDVDYDINYACSQDYEGETLTVLNWGEYMDQGLIEVFEETCNVKVVYEEADSNEAMQTRLLNSGTKYDILVPSDYMIERLINDNRLEEINFTNVPNYANISEDFQNKAHDPEDQYSVPYFWGTFGIMYNKPLIEELGVNEDELNDWNILKDALLKNNVMLYASSRDMFLVGFQLLTPNQERYGVSEISVNLQEGQTVDQYKAMIQDAKELLQAINNNANKYGTDDIKSSVANGDVAIGLVYNGDFLDTYFELEDEAEDTIGYALPEQGSNMWFDSMVIPTTTANKRLAEEFINFMLDPQVAYYNAYYVGYSTPHTQALTLLSEDEDYSGMVTLDAYNPESTEGLEVYRDLGEELNNALNEAYDELRGN